MKNEPLLYYRTKEQIKAYRKKSVEERLERIEAWMEFYNTVMTKKAKSIRDRFKKGEI
ncbi:MAG: hypothetical protein AAB065_02770 [Deltaproteobacteria bacterium]